jgi:hypothetical protein
MKSTSIGEKPYVIYYEQEFNDLMNSLLLRDLILIEVPKDSREYTMENGEKLLLHTDKKDDMLMQDSDGVVVKIGEKVKSVQVGDNVLYHYLLLNKGRDTPNSEILTFKYNDTTYLLISETQIFFAIRSGEYISLNGWYLVDGVSNDAKEIELNVGKAFGNVLQHGIVTLAKQDYKTDRCLIVCAPKESQYQNGEVVMTFGTWDVPIKSETMRKKEKRYFRCHGWNLLCREKFVENV